MRDLLFKDSVKQKSFAVSSFRRGVKEALLDYRVLQTAALNGSPAALVRVTLHTGRFHQIRCQFATRGRLAFFHPETHAPLVFEAAPPRIFPWDRFPWN